MAGYVKFSLSPKVRSEIEEDPLKVAAIFPSAVRTKGEGKSPLKLKRLVVGRLNEKFLYLPRRKIVKPKDPEGFWEELEKFSAKDPELFERYFPMPFRMKNGYYEVFLFYALDLRYGISEASYYPWLGGYVEELGGGGRPWIAALNILKTALNLHTAIQRYNHDLPLLPNGKDEWVYEIEMKKVASVKQRRLVGGIGAALGVGAAMMVAPYLPWKDLKYALVSALVLKELASVWVKDELRVFDLFFYHRQKEIEAVKGENVMWSKTAAESLLIIPPVLLAEGVRAFLLRGGLPNPIQALIFSFPFNPTTFLHSPAKLASHGFSEGVWNFLAGAMYLNFGYWGAAAYHGMLQLLPKMAMSFYLKFRDPFRDSLPGEERVKMPSYYPVYLDDIPSLDPELLK
ncbi:MAG: hypothetical protein GXN92_01710 [Candidatus Micrarchaeota archaeon]|nr:hypothetical protein [Candidatus Micrarchaeota archaeon]